MQILKFALIAHVNVCGDQISKLFCRHKQWQLKFYCKSFVLLKSEHIFEFTETYKKTNQ